MLLVLVVGVALVFDFTNGFHDTANAVATSVSTRALSPRAAVALAAAMNFAGALVTTSVARTIGEDLVRVDAVTAQLVLAALLGAIAWNLVTWWAGLPSSSTYALLGGLLGATWVSAGTSAIRWDQIGTRVALPALLSPVVGLVVAALVMLAVYWVFRNRRPGPLNRGFRIAQVASGSLVAFAHGASDAQKTMGVIVLTLVAEGRRSSFAVPVWVIVSAASAIALGTYAGGWRIMRTLGQRVIPLEPAQGFAAQTSAAGVLLATASVGLPISTTHVISGCIVGAGSARRLASVRWGVAADIAVAGLLTVPASAAIAALAATLT
ncbi:MAG: inorganic phosphate transporter, PiT family [Gaiellales bacterium]|nr:inorganic phosphate transporter, PiT family [Gaiellales bacterium]